MSIANHSENNKAVATEICLGVVGMATHAARSRLTNPWLIRPVAGMSDTGLGGGCFALVRSWTGSYECIDFRETAPAAASPDMFKGNEGASIRGGRFICMLKMWVVESQAAFEGWSISIKSTANSPGNP
jgi:hypothetical protein